MSDTPKTATEIMILDVETNRIAHRDRAVAISVARKVFDERFYPEAIEDMRDVRRMMLRALEYAAYEAIQKERELHKEDMTVLRSWMEMRVQEMNLRSPATIIKNTAGEYQKEIEA